MVLNVPMIKFYNGNEVPSFGLGTWKVSTITDIVIEHQRIYRLFSRRM